MSVLKKMGLFLSSFSPLFFLILIKEIVEIINNNWTLNFLNTTILITVFLMSVYGIFCFYLIKKELNKTNGQSITIKNKNNITDQHFLGYFSIFVLFAITFEIEYYSMALISFIILILIGIVYIKNDMYYINPFINLMGYSFYDVEYESSDGNSIKAKMFYKGQLVIGKKYSIKNKYLNFIFLIH